MRFSLRRLFAGVTVVAIVLGGVAVVTHTIPTRSRYYYNEVNYLAFSTDGTKLAAVLFNARDAGVPLKGYVADVSRAVALLDTATLTLSAVVQHQFLEGNQGPFLGRGTVVEFNQDGTCLDVLEWDARRLRTWDIASKNWTSSRGPSGVYAFSRSPDGSVEALVRQNSLEIRDARTRQLLLNQRTSGWHLVFSPDSKRFAVVTRKGIEVWDIDSKQLLRRYHENKDVLDGVTCLALSADNDTLTFRCQEGLHVCKISTGEVRVLLSEYFEIHRSATGWGTSSRTGDSTYGIEFSPDGKFLTVWGEYGLKFFDISKDYKLQRSEPELSLSCLAFSPDGKTYVTAGNGGIVTLWDTVAGTKIRSARLRNGGAGPPTFSAVK
jgi:WD40 repeat protein